MAGKKRNIFLERTENSIAYSGSQSGHRNYPYREDNKSHATHIKRKLKECFERSETQKQVAAIRYKDGTYLEFFSAVSFELASRSLENIPKGIRLLNIKYNNEKSITSATVFIPSGNESFFSNKI